MEPIIKQLEEIYVTLDNAEKSGIGARHYLGILKKQIFDLEQKIKFFAANGQ